MISQSSENRFWIPVAQNDGENTFFRVVMFLWSFPRQHFEQSSQNQYFLLEYKDLRVLDLI